jgi:hypothetical protein
MPRYYRTSDSQQDRRFAARQKTTVNTWYRYTYWDGAKQLYITLGASNPALGANNALWKKGISSFTYDVNGHMLGAVDAGVDGQAGTGDDVSFTYVDNAQGLTLRRDQIAIGAIGVEPLGS